MSTSEVAPEGHKATEDAYERQNYSESMLVYMARFLPRVVMRGIQWLQHPARNEYLDHPVLAPVKKEVFTNTLEVEGEVPQDLDGVYIRTGPNPQHRPWGGQHWFDGEAMVHAVCFEGGKAKSYSNHWLRAFRYCTEKAAGCNLYMRLGDMKGLAGVVLLMLGRVLRALLVPLPAEGPLGAGPLGNTALTVHGGRVFALMEGGLPFLLRLCAGAVRSLGAYTFGGGLSHSMTAHPKADPHTGELLAFSYDVQPGPERPHLVVYNIVSPSGEISRDYPVDVSRPQMMHDFAVTETYAVFMDHALVFDPEAMVRRRSLPFVMDRSGGCRIGLLRRAAPEAGVRWFDVAPFVCFHTATAWDDGDKVHVVLCKMHDIDLSLEGTDATGAPTVPPGFATRITLDTSTGEATETTLIPDWNLDFPVVPPASIARFTPFSYMAGEKISPDHPDTVGILNDALAKVELMAAAGEGLAGSIHLPTGMCGGEFSFVPRAAADAAAADDGYLVGYATHATTLQSYCLVYDAKTMSSTPLATVKLPQRVPAGFHGMWLSKQQLAQQPTPPARAA